MTSAMPIPVGETGYDRVPVSYLNRRAISALAALHLESLYELDARGRIVTVDPGDPPPRFHMLRTARGNWWLLRHDLPAEVASELERVLAREPVVGDFERLPPDVDRARRALERQTPPVREYRGPAFAFPETLPRVEPAELIAAPDDPRFQGAFAWVRAAGAGAQPIAARFAGDVAVAVCHSAASSARVAEAGVETNPAHRGRGHATAVTAAWAEAVRSGQRAPLYGTSWANGASRAVARKLGLVLYGEDWHIH